MEKARRRPGVEKTINEINDKDFRVRISGTVVEHDDADSTCIIDDGTGRAKAFFEGSEYRSLVKAGKLLRVIGKVRKKEDVQNVAEIDVEIVQDMSTFDLRLLEQTKLVLEKLR